MQAPQNPQAAPAPLAGQQQVAYQPQSYQAQPAQAAAPQPVQPMPPAPVPAPQAPGVSYTQATNTQVTGTNYAQPQVQQQQQQQQRSQPAAPQQGQIPQQQQHFPHQGLNGGWQSDKDYQDRRKMIAKIVHLLQQRKPNAPQEWLKKLPQMAKRLEESLYRSASSFDVYNDTSTLKHRLQQLAVNIGKKTKIMQQQALLKQRAQQQQPGNGVQYRPAPTQGTALGQPPSQPSQTVAVAPAAPAQNGQRMVNMSDINPIMASQVAAPAPVASAPTQIAAAPAQQVQYGQAKAPQQPPAAIAPSASAPAAGGATTAANGTKGQVSNREQVLRHQQQRLLLLRHAAKCQHQDGRCPVTPHCAGMKRLWKHIAECKNQKCMVPHCVSSRYVLSHYHRCKDVRCPVCGPVREAIHRSHEKQKQMQALKQSHQAVVQQNNSIQGAPLAQVTSAASTAAVVPPTAPTPVASQQPEPPNKRRKSSATGVALPAPSFQVQRPLPPPSRPGIAAPGGVRPVQPIPALSTTRPVPSSSTGMHFSSNGQVMMAKPTGPKPQEDHTLINCFSVEQIETHIASLQNGLQLQPQKLKTKCLESLKVVQNHQHAWVFNTPVDPVELGLPDYFEVIKNPMDLGTIRKRLENGVYHNLEQFEAHVHLTFDNAMLYNPEGSVVYNMASEMKVTFKRDFEKLIEQLNAEEDAKRQNGEACLLCGCEKLLFEPPVFYCNGMNCPSKRIRRNSYYYVGGNNQYHWCHQCFQELRDNSTIDLGDVTVKKEALTKKKNDEVHEESWVECDSCKRWVHQICALFNTRKNKDQRSEYTCPRCTIDERKRVGKLNSDSPRTPMAEDLPRTTLSEYLENHVRVKVTEFLEEKATNRAKIEGIPIEEARKKEEMGGAITIRQVTSMDRKLEVRERMKKRYAFKNYPDEFSYRCKCIVVFQNLDGVDVILFGLYVYEHDEKNPLPNKRVVYVSYLDSVHYMRPRQMRTFIYHEILISYLDSVRRRGFATAHIWACPPLKGDDYILYAKPEDQKTPKDDRLRQWYIDMLIESQRRGIVGTVTNMYDMYFSNPKNDATVVPYLEGDYFIAEAENIIKDIEEGKTGKKSSAQGKKKKDTKKQKKKSGRGGTRSTGLDEAALLASGIVPAGIDQKSLEEGGRDYVMVKLGETIQPMKESFIVAHLAWKGADPANMVVPKEIQEYRDKHGITWKIEEDSSEVPISNEKNDPSAKDISPDTPTSTGADKSKTSTSETATSKPSVDDAPPQSTGAAEGLAPMEGVTAEDKASESSKVGGAGGVIPPTTSSSPAGSQSANANVNLSIREGKFAAMAARKRDREGQPKEEEKKSGDPEKPKDKDKDKSPAKTITVKDSQGRMVKVLDDDEEELDCEFLNNRQAFLNLCQGNHYQFDHLRRAKHSSMMVLWHLHNRDAPKFVQQCATCSREILTGYRFHCPTCADFDQCQECYSNPKVVRHQHSLKPIPIATGQQAELTAAQRKERQRSIQLHMTLLLHAATCNNAKCPSANCTKMKGLLKHGASCQIKATGGCNVCKRIWALLQIHARQCKAKTCPVPNCMAIRERVRQLKKQQQAMDDRRRQEMNRAYRGKR